ncbi:hypothetical protein PIB30_080845, partial [Stylosanthes scabra]|nr:hypothetical protein [Stylosanthes scabra]
DRIVCEVYSGEIIAEHSRWMQAWLSEFEHEILDPLNFCKPRTFGQSASSSCAGTRTVNLIDGTGLVPSGMERSGNEGHERGQSPKTLLILLPFEEERKGRVERELSGGSGNHYSPSTSSGHNSYTGAPIDSPFAVTRSLSPHLRFYPRFERWNRLSVQIELGIQSRLSGLYLVRKQVLRFQESTLGTSESILNWTETKSYFQTSQGIDSSPSKSTFMREVNEGICGTNFPTSDNSGLSVVKGCPRNTHVVKYRHMMIRWKPSIMMIEQALGRYVASSGKYVLGMIRDIYWIGRVGYYNRPNELISHRDRNASYAFE